MYGLEPSPQLRRMARRRAEACSVPVELISGSAERIPMEGGSVDTVVTTWTLCTIPDAASSLREVGRVLKPDGRLIFVEHGRSPDPRVRAWQGRVTPLWRRLTGGCHVDRPVDSLITAAGFRIERLETGYVKGPRPLSYLFKGIAVRTPSGAGVAGPRDLGVDAGVARG